jgi:hypothetical protein
LATTITFPLPDGASYIIPAVDDDNWGQNVTNYLLAIPAGVPPRNGTFSLTGDLSFGPSFGLKSQYYKSLSIDIASTGFLRLAKTDAIVWRNNLNSADLPLAINGSNQLTFNGVPLSTGSSGVSSIAGTANQIIASSSTGNITLSTPQDIGTASSPTFAAVTLSSPLSVPNGGTGLATIGAHDILVGAATSAIVPVTPGTAGFVLTSNGTGSDPSCQPSGIGNVSATATSGTITPDATTANTFSIAVSGVVTLDGPTGGVDGQKVTFRIINDASHSVSLATGSGNFRFGTDITSYTNSVSLTDYIGAIWNAGDTRWDVVSVIRGF